WHHAGHGEDNQEHDGRSYEEQDELFKPYPPSVLLLGGQQKAHRRPDNDLEAAAIEQVNDGRNGGRPGAGDDGGCAQAEKGEQQRRELTSLLSWRDAPARVQVQADGVPLLSLMTRMVKRGVGGIFWPVRNQCLEDFSIRLSVARASR